MNDCEMMNHPNVTGAGCPCGLIARRQIRPRPYPLPKEVPEAAPMLRLLMDERDHRQLAARRRSVG